MPLSDQVLELVFAFLLEKGGGKTDRDLQLAALPACRLLQTRRTRGFEHVKQELLRRGLKWALEAKQRWERRARKIESELEESEHWVQTYKNVHFAADRLRLDNVYERELRDFYPRSNRDRESALET